jgi:cation diffusion facilitator CzcD-associated flavoprotein CzcO
MRTLTRMDPHDRQTVVIGAGPAGLATAAQIRRLGLPVLILERSNAVASSWRGRYDRLRLNSSRPFSKLPGARYPRGTGMFPSRDQVVEYLERYARDHALDIRFRTHVERIERNGTGWLIHTSTGTVPAGDVVVAAGYEHTFHVPKWPGRDSFAGRLIHSAEYRNADEFGGADVLVVGPGSSGMEIAYDLAEGGAARVRLAVRTPPNIILREPLGPFLARQVVKLPTARADRLMSFVRRRRLGDLSPFGLPEPEEGVVSRLKRLGVAPAIVDREVLDTIKAGRIEIVGAVEALDETGVVLADGERIEPDAVIAATGYRTGLEPMVGHLGVLDENDEPGITVDEAAPGLRFVAYVHRPGLIGLMGGEAKTAARGIARRRGERVSRRPAAPARPRAAQGA